MMTLIGLSLIIYSFFSYFLGLLMSNGDFERVVNWYAIERVALLVGGIILLVVS